MVMNDENQRGNIEPEWILKNGRIDIFVNEWTENERTWLFR